MTQADIQTVKTSHGKELKVHTYLFINNKFVPGHGPLIETINPTTEKVICSVHSANENDVNAAVKAAKDCYNTTWRKIAPAERARLLTTLADLMERDKDEIATLEALDNGKTFPFARDVDVTSSISSFRYYAGWADKVHGKTIDTGFENLCYTRHEPLGVVGAVIPWNFPLMMAVYKFAPALATGNTVVMKTSEITPLSIYKFAELVVEAGFPPGAINIITGYGHTTGAFLSTHPHVSKISFTGSTMTGCELMKSSACSNLKTLDLELGGKSAQIICADAKLKEAAHWACNGIFINQGQCCFAGSRILVQEDVFDEFLELFIAETKKIVLGDPFDQHTVQGPQINKSQFEKVLSYIKIGQDEGAKVALGGKRWGDKGYYIEPTILTHCTRKMRVMQEEIFGPVVVIATFKTIEEAIEIANDSEYGLAGGVYTSDLDTAIIVSNEIQAGTVWVNCYGVIDQSTPFGGYKQSGFGKTLGKHALQEYTQVKSVKIRRQGL